MRLRFAEAMIYCGQIDQALEQLASIEQSATTDPALTRAVAEMYFHCQRQPDAHRCYARVAQLRPQDPASLFNLATTSVTLGDLDAAHALFDQVIALNPDDFGAFQNRSMLRTWSAVDNHVEVEIVRSLLFQDRDAQYSDCLEGQDGLALIGGIA